MQTSLSKLVGFFSSSSGSSRDSSSSIRGHSQSCCPLIVKFFSVELLSFPFLPQLWLSKASSGDGEFSKLFPSCKSLHAGLKVVEYEPNDEVLVDANENLGEKLGDSIDDDEEGDELLPNP